MKRLTLPTRYETAIRVLKDISRRHGWFLENLTAKKLANLLIAGAEFGLKREEMSAWPVMIKVDISPLCNLRCPTCVHAFPGDNSPALLKRQSFSARQRMPLENFQKIVSEVSGKTMALSLYYLGDPLIHPDLVAICRAAWRGGLNTHISTNFSFDLSDHQISELIDSGLTHLTVCVDGLTAGTYERTRVGGRLQVVLDNLERLMALRRGKQSTYPKVEVQFIKFQHNVHELESALQRFHALGVDQVTDYWGALHNYVDRSAEMYSVGAPKANKWLPQCLWPHFSMLIKWDGEVIPCCTHRHADQYAQDGDTRGVGNVFQTSIRDIWNGPEYRRLRRMAANPEKVGEDPSLREMFCDRCPALFETTIESVKRKGNTTRWEDLYVFDSKGRAVRRQETLPEVVRGAS